VRERKKEREREREKGRGKLFFSFFLSCRETLVFLLPVSSLLNYGLNAAMLWSEKLGSDKSCITFISDKFIPCELLK
jgi:hypothetical protein